MTTNLRYIAFNPFGAYIDSSEVTNDSIGAADLTETWELIEAKNLDSADGTFSFTGINNKYKKLMLVGEVRSDRAAADNDNIIIEFNSDTTATNYTVQYLYGTATSVSTAGANANYVGQCTAATSTASVFSAVQVWINNRTTNTNRSFHHRGGHYNRLMYGSGHWANTALITAIALKPGTGTNFKQYSSVSLYGSQE